MAGKGGGAWKVAYADFVTAMMAFFMVMWLTSQKPEVKQAVAGYFRDPYALYKGNESGSASDGAPTTDPKLGHDANSQRRRVSNPGNDANYQFAVLFDDGDAEVSPAGREQIRAFAPTMVGKLNRVEVRAHCQRKPLPLASPYKDHWDLCYARARAVQQQLEEAGLEGDRIRLSEGGSNEPMATNLTEEELRLNSRVDVIMLDDLVDAPWQAPPTVDRVEEPLPDPEHDPVSRARAGLEHEDDAEGDATDGGAAADDHAAGSGEKHDEAHTVPAENGSSAETAADPH